MGGRVKNSAKTKKGGGSIKKIPTLFRRVYDDGGVVELSREVTAGCEWVLKGEGEATEKVDGAACAIIGGVFYKRYDAKDGKEPPNGAIPCQPAPDPYTGHWPHWVKVDAKKPSDKWFIQAWVNSPWHGEMGLGEADGTYEAVGLHFQTNPYGLDADFLEKHGRIKIPNFPRDYDGMREYLRTNYIEGVVFWKDGEPKCKIKRTDFGFKWPVKGAWD